MVDTGVFYAYFDRKDTHHLSSAALLYHCIEGRFGTPFTSDYVVLEATLLIQRKIGDNACLAFLDFLRDSGIRTIAVDQENYERALETMRENFPRLSMCDAATIVLLNSLGILSLASYDERSFQGMVHDVRGSNYFDSLAKPDQALVRSKILGKKS